MGRFPHVEIEGDDNDDDQSSPVPPEVLEAAKGELAPYFLRVDRSHPFMTSLLFEYSAIRHARLKGKEGAAEHVA